MELNVFESSDISDPWETADPWQLPLGDDDDDFDDIPPPPRPYDHDRSPHEPKQPQIPMSPIRSPTTPPDSLPVGSCPCCLAVGAYKCLDKFAQFEPIAVRPKPDSTQPTCSMPTVPMPTAPPSLVLTNVDRVGQTKTQKRNQRSRRVAQTSVGGHTTVSSYGVEMGAGLTAHQHGSNCGLRARHTQ